MAFQPVDCPKDCIYRGQNKWAGYPGCNYLSITGKLRRCDPGEGCEKYRPSRAEIPKRAPESIVVSANTTNRRQPAWDIALGYELWMEGKLSHRQIAERVGTTRATISERVNRCWRHGRL